MNELDIKIDNIHYTGFIVRSAYCSYVELTALNIASCKRYSHDEACEMLFSEEPRDNLMFMGEGAWPEGSEKVVEKQVEYLNKKYGSLEGKLTNLGVSKENIERIKKLNDTV